MRTLDEQDRELQEDEIDYDLGYIIPDQVFVAHHEAQEAVAEQGHYYPKVFYFEDSTRYELDLDEDKHPIEGDPHVEADEDGVTFHYVPQEGEDEKIVRGIDVAYIVDVEKVEAKDAYDEYEDINRYKLYTAEELAAKREREEKEQKQEQFIETGPERLDSAETNIEDLTVFMADMIGV